MVPQTLLPRLQRGHRNLLRSAPRLIPLAAAASRSSAACLRRPGASDDSLPAATSSTGHALSNTRRFSPAAAASWSATRWVTERDSCAIGRRDARVPTGRLLDLGCGTGRPLIEIEKPPIQRSSDDRVPAATLPLVSRNLVRIRQRDVRSDDADRRPAGWRRLFRPCVTGSGGSRGNPCRANACGRVGNSRSRRADMVVKCARHSAWRTLPCAALEAVWLRPFGAESQAALGSRDCLIGYLPLPQQSL